MLNIMPRTDLHVLKVIVELNNVDNVEQYLIILEKPVKNIKIILKLCNFLII